MKKQTNAGIGSSHPLDNIKIHGRNSWDQCLKQWQSPMSFDDRMSWLHTNYHRNGNGPEQFLFYLELADHYGDGSEAFSKKSSDKEPVFSMSSYASRAELKARLSCKAFTVLCTEFFSSQKDGRSQYPFILPYRDPLFSKLLWFFRPYGGHGGYDNLHPSQTDCLGKDGGKHYIQVSNAFAKKFILDAWQILNSRWYYGGIPHNCPDSAVAQPHWREIVTLLSHLHMIEELGYGQYMPRPWVFKNMVRKLLSENNIEWPDFYVEHIAHLDNLGKILEPLVIKGDLVAKYLYIARLNVHNPKHDEGHYILG